jgi:NADH-quinone oxidoreductase subunit I
MPPQIPSLKEMPGLGLLKGLGVTLKTMLTPAVTQQYPHEKPDLHPRTRGVIALMDENCTVCMLCAKECPDWCIYIESHKETIPTEPGGRTRTRNQLDRFAIDFALCMYCGICVEVCPFDALFWSPEFEYSTYSIGELLHEQPKLREWMDTVPPPPPLEEGAEPPMEVAQAIQKVEKEREAALEKARQEAAQAAQKTTATKAAGPAVDDDIEVEAEVDQEVYDKLIAEGKSDRVARARAKAAYVRREKARIRAEREEQVAAALRPPAADQVERDRAGPEPDRRVREHRMERVAEPPAPQRRPERRAAQRSQRELEPVGDRVQRFQVAQTLAPRSQSHACLRSLPASTRRGPGSTGG